MHHLFLKTMPPHTPLDTLLNSLGPNPSFILYSVKTLEANSFIIQLNEVQQEEFYLIQSACNAIPIQHEICLAHPASCQSTQMNTVNFEKAITKHSHSLHSLKRICEPSTFPPSEEILNRCHQGLRLTEAWSSQSVNSLSHAEATNSEESHLFSRSGIFEFSDPRSEEYYTVIEKLHSKNS